MKTENEFSGKLSQTEESLNGQIKRMTAEYETRSKHDKKVIDDLKLKATKDGDEARDRIDKLTKERDTNKVNFEKEKVDLRDANQKQVEKITQKFKADTESLKTANTKEKEEITAQFKSEEEKINKKKLELEKDLRNTKEQLRKTLEEREHFEKMKLIELESLTKNYKLVQEDQKKALERFQKETSEIKLARDQEIEKVKLEFKSEMDLLINELKETKSKANSDILDLEQVLREMQENIERLKRENESFSKKTEQETKLLREDYERRIANSLADSETKSKTKDVEIEKLKNGAKELEAKFKNEINELNVQRQNILAEIENEKSEMVKNYEQRLFDQTQSGEEKLKILEAELTKQIDDWKDKCSKGEEQIHNLNVHLQEMKNDLEKVENNAKKELDHLSMVKEKELSVLGEEINVKNGQIAEIEAKHASQLDELQDKHKEEMLDLMSEYQRFKTESDSKVSAIEQQFNFEILGKNNEIVDLSGKLENTKKDKDQQMNDYESKLFQLKEEHEKMEQSLKDEHAMEIQSKMEHIESLNKNIEFLQQEQLKEQENFREVLKSYKEYFTQLKVEMDAFIDELNLKHDEEKRKLNADIETLNVEKVQIMEQWKTMEKELTESHFEEVKKLKEVQFTKVKALDEELRATEEALKDMTLERDVQIDENKNKQARIQKLEADYQNLTDDINRRIAEMTQNILKLESEKKAEFEEHQKEFTTLNDSKNSMESAKDKLFHDLKENLENQLRNLKQESDAKIAKQSQDKEALKLQLKELNQKFIGTCEEKDALLSKTRNEISESYEQKLSGLKKEYERIVNEKTKLIDEMFEKSEAQRRDFENSVKTQKSEFQKILSERDVFISKLKEEHSQSVKEVEEHCELYKTNAESKVKELNSTRKNCKETVSLKDGEIERFLLEVS